jgi:hypothetical protein
MTTANHLINALAADNKDAANSAFESMIQDRLADHLEVRKVELASTIMDDLQEGQGMDAQRRWTRHVSAIGKDYEGGLGHKVSVHRQELKGAARKYFKNMGGVPGGVGAEYVDRGAKFVKDARSAVKRKAVKEETLEEGGPTRKHFQQTADLIKSIEHPEKRKEMANHHASLFKQQNPRFDRAKFMAAAGVNEDTQLDEVLSGGSKSAVAPSNATLNRNVMTNIRRAMQTLRIKGINPTQAAAGHRDFSKLAAKNPKAPGYMLMRKLGAQKAQAVQSLSQSGVPLGQSLEANPNEFNQALQRIKRFK